MKFSVEVSPDSFDEVTAHEVKIGPGGSLLFFDQNGRLIFAFAPGEWITVSEDSDA